VLLPEPVDEREPMPLGLPVEPAGPMPLPAVPVEDPLAEPPIGELVLGEEPPAALEGVRVEDEPAPVALEPLVDGVPIEGDMDGDMLGDGDGEAAEPLPEDDDEACAKAPCAATRADAAKASATALEILFICNAPSLSVVDEKGRRESRRCCLAVSPRPSLWLAIDMPRA
jgi:hypothetical protein